MKPIYSIENDLVKTQKRLENSAVPDNVKEKIFEFVGVLREGSGIQEHRESSYFEQLTILSKIMGSSILNPSKSDVIKTISELRGRITIRHTHYSPSTISVFIKTLKKFVKYVNDGELPKFWNDIHAEKIGSRYTQPEEMITYDELQLLLKACRNVRDKALLSVLFDSGIRASELLLLKIGDFKKSSDGMYATLNIQKGSKNYKQRTVVITGDSVVLVPQYIEYLKDNQKDTFSESGFLFIGIGKENLGKNLTYNELIRLIKKISLRSGITKPITPHLFRHSAATRMAVETPIQVFTKQMGWSSNKMADNYTHLDTKGQITAILKSQGIAITEEELKKPLAELPRKCPRCHVLNTGGASYCSNCGSPVKHEDFIKMEEQRNKVLETLNENNLISTEVKNLLDMLPESKDNILTAILRELEKEGKLSERRKKIRNKN